MDRRARSRAANRLLRARGGRPPQESDDRHRERDEATRTAPQTIPGPPCRAAVLAGDADAFRVSSSESAAHRRSCYRILATSTTPRMPPGGFVTAYRALGTWRGEGPSGLARPDRHAHRVRRADAAGRSLDRPAPRGREEARPPAVRSVTPHRRRPRRPSHPPTWPSARARSAIRTLWPPRRALSRGRRPAHLLVTLVAEIAAQTTAPSPVKTTSTEGCCACAGPSAQGVA